MPRTATVRRTTAETAIELILDLDGTGAADVATGVGFFDHMLTHVARHGLFDLTGFVVPATSTSTPTTPSRTWGICFGLRRWPTAL